MNRHYLIAAFALASAAIAASPAAMAEYPDKPIRMIVPYVAGGAADLVEQAARAMLVDLDEWRLVLKRSELEMA